MKRREFITLLTGTAIAGPRVAIAQPASKIYRVGTLSPGAPLGEKSPLALILLQVLEKHGYTRGKNLEFESRGAGGQMNKLGEIVREMKANQVDVIVGGGFPTALACNVGRTHHSPSCLSRDNLWAVGAPYIRAGMLSSHVQRHIDSP
jgi:putative tryptophan/tyrosine transport system substrate-binding protein